MSMNLHSEHFEFWQTPTEVTFEILKSDAEGNEPSTVEILCRYENWVKQATLDAILCYPDNREFGMQRLSACVSHLTYIWSTYSDLLDKWERSEIKIYMM